MKLLIDSADIIKIRALCEYYPIDGVTTNPSILSKSGRPPFEVLQNIRNIIGNLELHAQVVSPDADGMIAEGRHIREMLGENTYVKVPAVKEGFKAMKALRAEGILVTATAIYTPMQAYLSAHAGANYAAPYVNRIDNLGADGIASAKAMHDIFVNGAYNTQILAASFKNSQQMLELCRYGIGAATAAPDVIENLTANPTVTAAIEAFTADFESLCGKGRTMLDFKK